MSGYQPSSKKVMIGGGLPGGPITQTKLPTSDVNSMVDFESQADINYTLGTQDSRRMLNN